MVTGGRRVADARFLFIAAARGMGRAGMTPSELRLNSSLLAAAAATRGLQLNSLMGGTGQELIMLTK